MFKLGGVDVCTSFPLGYRRQSPKDLNSIRRRVLQKNFVHTDAPKGIFLISGWELHLRIL